MKKTHQSVLAAVKTKRDVVANDTIQDSAHINAAMEAMMIVIASALSAIE